jgi:hypothetical protein
LLGLEPLLFPALDYFDILGHWQILRHRATQFVNGSAHCPTHGLVDAIRVILVAHVFPAQLFLRLRGSEQIRRQFRAAHAVVKMFLGFQPFPRLDVAHTQSAVKSAITMIHENGVIQRPHRFITNINILNVDVFYILVFHSWKSELSTLPQTPFALCEIPFSNHLRVRGLSFTGAVRLHRPTHYG